MSVEVERDANRPNWYGADQDRISARSRFSSRLPVVERWTEGTLRWASESDYHPREHALVARPADRDVDWTSGSWGPAAVDTAHMRWNLALTYGLDAAEEFLRLHGSPASDAF